MGHTVGVDKWQSSFGPLFSIVDRFPSYLSTIRRKNAWLLSYYHAFPPTPQSEKWERWEEYLSEAYLERDMVVTHKKRK